MSHSFVRAPIKGAGKRLAMGKGRSGETCRTAGWLLPVESLADVDVYI